MTQPLVRHRRPANFEQAGLASRREGPGKTLRRRAAANRTGGDVQTEIALTPLPQDALLVLALETPVLGRGFANRWGVPLGGLAGASATASLGPLGRAVDAFEDRVELSLPGRLDVGVGGFGVQPFFELVGELPQVLLAVPHLLEEVAIDLAPREFILQSAKSQFAGIASVVGVVGVGHALGPFDLRSLPLGRFETLPSPGVAAVLRVLTRLPWRVLPRGHLTAAAIGLVAAALQLPSLSGTPGPISPLPALLTTGPTTLLSALLSPLLSLLATLLSFLLTSLLTHLVSGLLTLLAAGLSLLPVLALLTARLTSLFAARLVPLLTLLALLSI